MLVKLQGGNNKSFVMTYRYVESTAEGLVSNTEIELGNTDNNTQFSVL